MIFISVGTSNKDFNRLLKECDNIALGSSSKFFAQIGNSAYIPTHIPHKRWLSTEEMQHWHDVATIFIIHAGFGTVSELIRLRKPIIIVPRTIENGEAVNDQGDLSSKLHDLGFVEEVKDIAQLRQALSNINSQKYNPYNLTSTIPSILEDFIINLTSNACK